MLECRGWSLAANHPMSARRSPEIDDGLDLDLVLDLVLERVAAVAGEQHLLDADAEPSVIGSEAEGFRAKINHTVSWPI
jgi:hypothetical protein